MVTLSDNRVIFLGSFDFNNNFSIVQIFTPWDEKWNEIRSETAPKRLFNPSATVDKIKDVIYLTGANSTKVFILDCNKMVWTKLKGEIGNLRSDGTIAWLPQSRALFLIGGHVKWSNIKIFM